MADAISSAGGTFYSQGGSSLVTLSVTPITLGNAFVFTCSYVATATLSTVSGGGCTTWTKLVGAFTAYSGSAKIDLWLGTVTGSIGSGVNITIAGTGLTNTQRLSALEFTSGGGAGTVWALDGAQTGTKTNASSATVAFPTLTPSGLNRMYAGYGLVANTALTTGQTAGYTVNLDPGSNPYFFSSSVANSAQSPTCAQNTAGLSGTIAALVTAINPPRLAIRETSSLVSRFRSVNY